MFFFFGFFVEFYHFYICLFVCVIMDSISVRFDTCIITWFEYHTGEKNKHCQNPIEWQETRIKFTKKTTYLFVENKNFSSKFQFFLKILKFFFVQDKETKERKSILLTNWNIIASTLYFDLFCFFFGCIPNAHTHTIYINIKQNYVVVVVDVFPSLHFILYQKRQKNDEIPEEEKTVRSTDRQQSFWWKFLDWK